MEIDGLIYRFQIKAVHQIPKLHQIQLFYELDNCFFFIIYVLLVNLSKTSKNPQTQIKPSPI